MAAIKWSSIGGGGKGGGKQWETAAGLAGAIITFRVADRFDYIFCIQFIATLDGYLPVELVQIDCDGFVESSRRNWCEP